MKIAHARGEEDVNIGDRFEWWDGSRWEIVSFVGRTVYSPSGIGGTGIVALKAVDDAPANAKHLKHAEADGTVHWCGDSVAAGLATGRIKP